MDSFHKASVEPTVHSNAFVLHNSDRVCEAPLRVCNQNAAWEDDAVEFRSTPTHRSRAMLPSRLCREVVDGAEGGMRDGVIMAKRRRIADNADFEAAQFRQPAVEQHGMEYVDADGRRFVLVRGEFDESLMNRTKRMTENMSLAAETDRGECRIMCRSQLPAKTRVIMRDEATVRSRAEADCRSAASERFVTIDADDRCVGFGDAQQHDQDVSCGNEHDYGSGDVDMARFTVDDCDRLCSVNDGECCRFGADQMGDYGGYAAHFRSDPELHAANAMCSGLNVDSVMRRPLSRAACESENGRRRPTLEVDAHYAHCDQAIAATSIGIGWPCAQSSSRRNQVESGVARGTNCREFGDCESHEGGSPVGSVSGIGRLGGQGTYAPGDEGRKQLTITSEMSKKPNLLKRRQLRTGDVQSDIEYPSSDDSDEATSLVTLRKSGNDIGENNERGKMKKTVENAHEHGHARESEAGQMKKRKVSKPRKGSVTDGSDYMIDHRDMLAVELGGDRSDCSDDGEPVRNPLEIDHMRILAGAGKAGEDSEVTASSNKRFIKPPKFNGDGSIETFLCQFATCAKHNKWSEEDKVAYMQVSLEGSAAQILWDSGNPAELTLDALIFKLRQRFGSIDQAEKFQAELRTRRRRYGETLSMLYMDIRRLMALAYPTEASSKLGEIIAKDAFIAALDDKEMALKIMEKEVQDLDSAFTWAVRFDAYATCLDAQQGVVNGPTQGLRTMHDDMLTCVLKNNKADQSSGASQNVSRTDSNVVIDDLRQQLNALQREMGEIRRTFGHLHFERRKEANVGASNTRGSESTTLRVCERKNPIICYRCHERGHIARQCRMHRNRRHGRNLMSGKDAHKAPVVPDAKHDSAAYLTVNFEGVSHECLLDTGSDMSIIPYSIVKGNKLEPVLQRMRAADGTLMDVRGRTTITVDVGDRSMEIDGLVYNGVDQLIVGIDWLTSHDAVWDVAKAQVSIDGLTYPLHSRPTVALCRRILTARTAITAATSKRVNDKILVPSLNVMKQDKFCHERVTCDFEGRQKRGDARRRNSTNGGEKWRDDGDGSSRSVDRYGNAEQNYCESRRNRRRRRRMRKRMNVEISCQNSGNGDHNDNSQVLFEQSVTPRSRGAGDECDMRREDDCDRSTFEISENHTQPLKNRYRLFDMGGIRVYGGDLAEDAGVTECSRYGGRCDRESGRIKTTTLPKM